MSMFYVYAFLGYLLIFLMVIGFYPLLHSRSYNHWKAIPQFILILGGLFTIFYFTFSEATINPDGPHGQVLMVTILLIIFGLLRSTYLYYVVGYGKRRAGPRERPFRYKHVMGIGMLVLTLIIGYGYFIEGLEFKYLARLFLLGLGTSYFTNLDELFASEGLLVGGKNDKVHPRAVLFIRSFRTENAPFWTGWTSKSPLPNPTFDTAFVAHFTFRKYLGKSFFKHMITLVGLGNPMDTIPEEGMVVSYEEDGNWQEALLQQLKQCEAVVMTVGNSTNLSWELHKIRELNMLNKFFILIAPRQNQFFYQAHLLFMGLRKATPTWSQFRKQMKTMGYTLPNNRPKPGTVFAFDPQSQAYPIIENAYTPDDYVLAIKNKVEST